MLSGNSSLLHIQQLIQTKQLSPVELLEYYLSRISEHDEKVGAFTLVNSNDSLKAARDAEDLLMKSSAPSAPFTGIPIAVKSLTAVKGWPADKCSRTCAGKTEVISHDIIAALQRAGFILIGQTASPELGSLPITESALYGDTRNPWNLEHTPGGSSGGAAAAVCADFVPLAEGSDGGGSIRIPASCCGLVGLKPSRGRVGVGPVLTASEISMKGVLTRTVADTAALLDIIKASDPDQWHIAPDGKDSFLDSLHNLSDTPLNIAVCTVSPLGGPVDTEVSEAVQKVADLFNDAGHNVFEGSPDWGSIEQFVEDFMLYWSTLMAELEVSDEKLFEPHTRKLREAARQASAVDFRRAMTRLQRTSRSITKSWHSDFDLLLTPTIARLPPKIGEITNGSETNPDAPVHRSFEMVPFTAWFNVTGQPAISVPVSLSNSGLPIGVQMVAGPWQDRSLLQVASWVEGQLTAPKWKEHLLTPTT